MIYWFKNHIERREENDNARAVSEKAGERDAKLRFVRHDILSGLRRIARNDKRAEQRVVARTPRSRHASRPLNPATFAAVRCELSIVPVVIFALLQIDYDFAASVSLFQVAKSVRDVSFNL